MEKTGISEESREVVEILILTPNIAAASTFKCVIDPEHTVGWVADVIRERFNITGGSIDCNGVYAKKGEVLCLNKRYVFVDPL